MLLIFIVVLFVGQHYTDKIWCFIKRLCSTHEESIRKASSYFERLVLISSGFMFISFILAAITEKDIFMRLAMYGLVGALITFYIYYIFSSPLESYRKEAQERAYPEKKE